MASSASSPAPSAVAGVAMTADDYDKLSQREHILLRPGMYIGSTALEETEEWVYDRADQRVVKRVLVLPEAIKRCFYEAISNASDAVIRSRERGFDPKEIVVTMDDTTISITNYGCPIPVVKHGKEGKWVPEMIFSDFLSSSNYNTKQVRTGIGLNGLGIKLVGVFSSSFTVSLDDHINHKAYTQTFRDHLQFIDPPSVVPFKGTTSRVTVSYTLDFAYFRVPQYTEDDKDLFARFVMDYSLSCAVPTRFNDLVFPVQTALSMATVYFGETATATAFTHTGMAAIESAAPDESASASARKASPAPKKFTSPYEWVLMDTPFEGQVIAFVNGMMVCAGVHVDALYKSIAEKVLPAINQDMNGKPMLSSKDLKQHTSLLLVCKLPDPAFKSQVKSHLASPEPTFSALPPAFVPTVKKWELMNRLKNILEQKESSQLSKTDGKKRRHISVPGYTTCNWAGGPKSTQCTLCITEGNSAETYGVKGRARVDGGIDRLGLYRLRGKLLNVMNAKIADVAKNREVQGLKEVIGLREGVDYSDDEHFKKLRYGKVRIMTDADNDGKHIACLIINYFHYYYPSLVKRGYLEILLTPIIRVWKGDGDRHKAKHRMTFYTQSEFVAWKQRTTDWKSWKFKYFKGLATSVDKDIDEDYKALHTVQVDTDDDTPAKLRLAFNDQLAHQRKVWMQQWTPELEVPPTPTVSVSTYIDKGLIHYSVVSVQRNIPSFLDGLKEGQRKVIAAALKKWSASNAGAEIKVAQLASYTSEMFNYHYGEAALQETITAMAQDFVGANNLRFFEQHGQFGTRLKGGKDAGSPRYIYVKPERWVREVFRAEDDALLTYLEDEGEVQEPAFYLPIFPMWAVNGALGIATGYSTMIPNHNPIDVCAWLEARLLGTTPMPTLKPWYRGFRGKLTLKTNPKKKPVSAAAATPTPTLTDGTDDGEAGSAGAAPLGLHEASDGLGADEVDTDADVSLITEGTYTAQLHKGIHVTELPIGRWTDGYMKWLDQLLDPRCKCGKSAPNYGMKDETTPTCCSGCKTSEMVMKDRAKPMITERRLCSAEPEQVDIYINGFSDPSNKALRLRKSIGLTNMVLLDERQLPVKLASVADWMERFYTWRLPYYAKRKDVMLAALQSTLTEAREKQAFIAAVVNKQLVFMNRTKDDVLAQCKALNVMPRYLTLPLNQLTQDEITELERKINALQTQYDTLAQRQPEALWIDDLHAFVAVFKKTIGVNVKRERD